EELAADGTATARGADDGDRRGPEERAERVDDRNVVTMLDLAFVVARRRNREAQLDLVRISLAGHLEPGGVEHAQSRSVRGQDVGDEARDPVPPCGPRELLEQPCSDAPTLLVVRHRARHLRPLPVPPTPL